MTCQYALTFYRWTCSQCLDWNCFWNWGTGAYTVKVLTLTQKTDNIVQVKKVSVICPFIWERSNTSGCSAQCSYLKTQQSTSCSADLFVYIFSSPSYHLLSLLVSSVSCPYVLSFLISDLLCWHCHCSFISVMVLWKQCYHHYGQHE